MACTSVPCLTNKEANETEQLLLCILHHNYNGRDWVDDAMVHLCDDGLCTEVHQFRKLQEEPVHRTEEVRVLEDHITEIYLELCPCMQ